jgi:transaldolase
VTTLSGRSRLPLADSPLGRTIATTATDVWNDSCAIDELEYALSYGAVGATANPTIVVDVWRKDPAYWHSRVAELAVARPSGTVADIAWAVVEEMSVRGARLLEPVFEEQAGRQGRLSVQTDPTLFRSPERMVEQALAFSGIAPNIIVKLPATSSGIEAIEAATYLGISVNVTVSFTVAQALAAAEAIERGLRRRDSEGLPIDRMGPVVTLMMGRMEDWLRVIVERDGVTVDPDALPWSGVAVFKRAYGEFVARRYRARLLGAAIRHHYHWSELIGGDVVITMPSTWQRRFNASTIEVRPRMDEPVEPRFLDELQSRLPDFVRAYEPDGLARDEFDAYGATARTLRAFIASYQDLLHEVTDALVPDPDRRKDDRVSG